MIDDAVWRCRDRRSWRARSSVVAPAGYHRRMGRTSRLCEFPPLIARTAEAIGDAGAVRSSPAEFALVEHVWHLAEIETEAYQFRLARLSAEAAPWLPNFDGDRLAIERGYLARSVAAGVRAFSRARAVTVKALGRIRGAGWLRGGIQEHVGYVTLGELPERMIGHDKSHAVQLAELVAALRPGHAMVDELRRWSAGIVEAPASPCNRVRTAHRRTAAALPLARIQRAIAASVVAGEVSPVAIGRALGLSARTLQRRLAEHGLTVQCLVEEFVRALAVDRMRSGADWRAAAHELGFADPRAFARAFKRWTQVTPHAFQRAPAVTRLGCG